MRLAVFAFACMSVLLVGCGQLGVRIDVLDPEHVRNEMSDERLRKLYRGVVAAAPGELAGRMDAQARDYTREMARLVQKYAEVGRKLGGVEGKALEEVAETLLTDLATGTPARAAAAQGTLVERRAQELRTFEPAVRWAGRGPIPSDVRDRLLALEAAVKEPQVQQRLELRELRNSANRFLARVNPPASFAAAPAAAASAAAVAPQVKAANDQAAAVASITQRSIIGDGSLASTEFAYVVARAPNDLWANNFNRAYASGTFGNVDMVIRLNSTADFSVKGLLFDASKVAQVASKVMTQAVLLGSQMSGVPVATASTGTASGGDALSKASADLATVEGAIAKRQALVASQRDAVRSLARTILGSAPPLETAAFQGKDDKDPLRVPMHKGIDDSLTALRPLLAMQDLQ